jgi:hypothetical protein
MTTQPSVSQMPWFAIAYGLIGFFSICYGLLRRSRSKNSLLPLGGVAVSIGSFNWFAQHGILLNFETTVIILVVVFALTLRALSIRLMELTVADRKLAERFSFLPLLYLFLFFLVVSAKEFATFKNPPLAVFMFIVVACALHVCGFAFGKSQAIRRLAATDKLRPTTPDRSEFVAMWRYTAASLIVPTLLALGAQVTSYDDWRLMGINASVTGTLVCLIAVGCSRRSSA